jgi:GDP/UDP-N,N'-diacetylbacillosamine 2-epimerase (hydrolysing)
MKESLTALEQISLPVVIISPNSDAGSRQILTAIDEFSHLSNFKHLANIPRLEFVNLMRKAACLIGNSSAGILEAPSLKMPVVNVGNRQKGRLHAENVQFVDHNAKEIEGAVRRALYDEEYKKIVASCSNPYGDGDSSKKITKILSDLVIDEHFLIKEISY